jgi:hypothetical protein
LCIYYRNAVAAGELKRDDAESLVKGYIEGQALKTPGKKPSATQTIFVSQMRGFAHEDVLKRIPVTQEGNDDYKPYDDVLDFINGRDDLVGDAYVCCMRVNSGITKPNGKKPATDNPVPDYSASYMQGRVIKAADSTEESKEGETPKADKKDKPVTPLENANAARREMKAVAMRLKDSGIELSPKEIKMIEKIIARYDMF